MENVETKKRSRCKKIEVAENYKQCKTCLEYCRAYSKNNADKRNAYAKDYVEKRKAISSQKMYCNDCKIEVQKGSWPQHIKSKGHLWNTRKDCREFDDKQKWMTCPVCKNYPIQSQNYKRHLGTALHSENLKKMES